MTRKRTFRSKAFGTELNDCIFGVQEWNLDIRQFAIYLTGETIDYNADDHEDKRDEPGVEYPSHSHKGKVSMYILQGGLTPWLGEEEVSLVQGDRFDVPAEKEHVARVGTDGCTFLVGEMIKGDS